ncbi:MAG: hypothetical protein HY300_15695 [Verrucomicrobia bacterium]|nr:hypothetical protein [Verrucomicrobiota bacterium]
MKIKLFLPPLFACIALVCAGCSTFDRDWKAAADTPAAPGSIEGRWEGTWKSDRNGHNDSLRCLLTRTGTNTYAARFHAMYQKILSFTYTAPLAGREENGKFKFTGQADLGIFAGGLYHYDGIATPTNYLSTYRCPSDWGTFQMQRP